jgi:hypothetical protein
MRCCSVEEGLGEEEDVVEVDAWRSEGKLSNSRAGQNNNLRECVTGPVAVMSTEAMAHASAGSGLAAQVSALPATVASPSTATSSPRKFPNTYRIFTQLICTLKFTQNDVFYVLHPLETQFLSF